MTDMRPDDFNICYVIVVEIVSKSSNALIPPLGCFIIRAEKLNSMTLNALLAIHGIIKNYVAISKQPAVMFSLFWALRTVLYLCISVPPQFLRVYLR